MTRKFLEDIRGQIASTLPDNTTGQITPANHRQLLIDFLDSTTDLRAELFKTVPEANFTPGTTFSPITNYDTINGGDPGFLILDGVGGTITSGPQAGYNYNIVGQLQFSGDNNEEWEVGIAGNGVVETFNAGVTTGGAGRPVTAIVVADVFSGAANAAIDLRIRHLTSATEQIDIAQASLFAVLLPTETAPP